MNKAVVKYVISGDTLLLRSVSNAVERTVHLAKITVPRFRPAATEQEPFAFESRDALRQLCLGKEIQFRVEHEHQGREWVQAWVRVETTAGNYATEDITRWMIREGWGKVRDEAASRMREEDAKELEALMELQIQAQTAGKGMWATQGPKLRVFKPTFTDAWTAEAFLAVHKGKELPALVEQVRDGTTLRLQIVIPGAKPTDPTEHCFVNVVMSGVKAPAANRPEAGVAGEPFGDQARAFSEARLLQRRIHVILEGVVNPGTLAGTIRHPAGSIAQALVQAGLAKVFDWTAMWCTDGSAPLRAAEKAAKSARVGVWKDFAEKALPAGVAKEWEGTVVRIVGGDMLDIVRNDTGKEHRIQIAGIRAPKLRSGDNKEVVYANEAREFLRKRLIGKSVKVHVDYVRPAEGEFEARECATLHQKEFNVGEGMISRGLATAVRYRKDDQDRPQDYDKLLVAEEKAKKEFKGVHNPKDPPPYVAPRDVSESSQRAKAMLSAFQRAGRTPAIVEHIANGGRVKLYLPRENCKLTLVFSNLRVPRLAMPNTKSPDEPFAREAAEFVTKRCLQRDVEFEVETVDRTGAFVGTLWMQRGSKLAEEANLSVVMLRKGLARLHDLGLEKNTYAKEMTHAELLAKDEKLNIWSLESQEEVPVVEEQPMANGGFVEEYVDVVVTDVRDNGEFSVQIVNQEVRQLEGLMQQFSLYHENLPAGATPAGFRPRVGDLCSALFSEDNAWYRARVKTYLQGGMAEVVFVDFGNMETMPVSRLRPIAEQFRSLGPQARDAVLAHVRVPGVDTDYGRDATEHLSELINGKSMVANIVYKAVSSSHPPQLHLILYDTSSGSLPTADASINAEMCRAGYARVDAKVPYASTTNGKSQQSALMNVQAEAKRRHYGMWEYGDPIEDEDDSAKKTPWGRR